MAIKRAKMKRRNESSAAARRWLRLSKLIRNERLSHEEIKEMAELVQPIKPSSPDILVSRD